VAVILAAEYLRMSTEHQQYSLDNQAAAIRRYARTQGFEVVRSYVDSGKSGLVLKHRRGLARLLSDVVGGPQPYRAILVYDVSRWGRFQDADESAYYEFLCKNAGTPVHYCAETFVNDGAMPNVVMKALKRVMAAEYSRDLSCKVFEGEKRINELGFRTGGTAGYGLRRMLCAPDGSHKQILSVGQRKSILTDRVTLVPGPPEEVQIVREIFRMVVVERKPLYRIAEELNNRGIKYCGKRWVVSSVQGIARNPKYMGTHVWGRCTQKLGGAKVQNRESARTVKKCAFESIVDEATFTAAQQILRHCKPDEYLLDCLRSLLATEGWLGRRLLTSRSGLPCVEAYVRRFGSLRSAFALVGYGGRELSHQWETLRRIKQLRSEVVRSILALFPHQVRLEQRTKQHRPILHFDGGPPLLIVVCKSIGTRTAGPRWLLPGHLVWKEPVLLCRCNPANTALRDFYLLGRLPCGRPTFREDDSFLRKWRGATNLLSLFGSGPRVGGLLEKIQRQHEAQSSGTRLDT
jgi:DNA invertase Pin-like site-specific DNA recombinase